ncbi:hypothetical protein N0V82_002071 [Gnomoniopsis sp. IMI 355080]|nr:hypothetical protein N0V82_002071 [Gnomoniopsis sp. IMI 355080]
MSATPIMSRQQDAPAADPAPASKSPFLSVPDTVNFFGSQIGDETVINYSYTDSPWKIIRKDIYYFFYYIWALPYIVFPFKPCDSGALSELSPTSGNIFCIFVHTILVILQLGFIFILFPLALFIPLWTTILLIGAFLVVNGLLCKLLNGSADDTDIIFHSDPQYALPDQPRFAHEQWVFLNGVAVGSHWMKSNLNRLALTFGRPIVGIHNRTSGIVFDVIECLVQRNLSYATEDIRQCYRVMKEKLYDPQYSKVVFIVHSQGGIEGGLVLDWLLQELPQDLLSKLEVYTFGNAANHFNNPFHTVGNQAKAEKRSVMGAKGVAGAVGLSGEKFESEHSKGYGHGNDGRHQASNGFDHRRPPTPTSPFLLQTNIDQYSHPVVETPISELPTTRPARAIRVIEHYAHTTDFVALWGVIHFAATPLASNMIPRFLGKLFAYESPNGSGGHQLVQHYLDGMFPLQRDPKTGRFVGAKEKGNAFMESYVTVCGKKRSLKGNKARREDVLGTWLDTLEAQEGDEEGEVQMLTGDTASMVRQKMGLCDQKVQVKELSRLWKYRNGRIPKDKPPFLKYGVDGAARNATL